MPRSLRSPFLLLVTASVLAGNTACQSVPAHAGETVARGYPAGGGVSALVAEGSVAEGVQQDGDVTWVRGPAVDRARLDRWRAGVGPAVVLRGHDRLPPRTGHTAGPLTIVSWNTNVGGGDLHGLLADLRAGRLTGGDSVHHFVLLLQEVYRGGTMVPRGDATRPRRIATRPPQGSRSDIVEVARAHGLHLFYVPSMANGWDGNGAPAEDRGNAIVSTLPLTGQTAIELPFEGQRRVAASATVMPTDGDGNVRTLRAVSVHLDNRSTFSRALRSFGSGRARQAESLASALLRDSAATLPTVLAGDLNTWAPTAWERAVSVLRAHFPHGNRVQEPTYAGPPMGVGRTLDHMMFRLPDVETDSQRSGGPAVATTRAAAGHRTPTAVRLDDPRGSDHYPLLAQLLLPGAN